MNKFTTKTLAPGEALGGGYYAGDKAVIAIVDKVGKVHRFDRSYSLYQNQAQADSMVKFLNNQEAVKARRQQMGRRGDID